MLNLIVAPYEQAENAEKYCKRIVAYLKQEKIEFAVYFSNNLDSIIDSIKEAQAMGENEFVVIGDDATISVFVNAVKDLSKIKFGIVPVGVNDDFAKFLGLSQNPIQAIKDILLKQVSPVDYLLVNDLKVVNNVLVGASAEVFEKFSQSKIKNFITLKFSQMRYASDFEGVPLVLDFKGVKAKEEVVFELSIANGGLKQGKKVSPLSNVSDGLFNFNYIALPEKNDRKKYFSLFKSGAQIYEDATNQFWLSSLKITQPDKKIKALIDGRIFNLEEINVQIVENGLKLYRNLSGNEQ